MAVTVVSWNIAKRQEPWRQLLEMDADVALLQEAVSPPSDVAGSVDTGPAEHWDSHVWNSRWYEDRYPNLYDRWPMVVKLSDRVDVEWFKQVSPIGWTECDEIAVSGIGTIAAARVTSRDGSAGPFIAVSMYGRWIGSHPSVKTAWRFGYADSSVHRIISDLSAFIGHENPQTHRILAAGDLNIAVRLWRWRRPLLLGGTIPVRFREDGHHRAGVHWAAGTEWSAGGDAGDGRARRLPERRHVPPPRQEPRDGKQHSARLRLRLPRLPRGRHGAGHEFR